MKTKQVLSIILIVCGAAALRAQSIGGVLNTNTTVCAGQNSGVLSLSSYTGTILRWEVANSPGGPWTAMMLNSNTYSYLNLVQSTYFRVVVQAAGYSQAYSNAVSVTCDSPSYGGTITGNTLQCISLSHTTTLSGNTGTTITWEKSTTGWLITSSVSGNSNTMTSGYNAPTQVRAKIKNGTCPVAYSNTLTITPAAASGGGQLSGPGTVCATASNPSLSLSNFSGSVAYWESAPGITGPWNIIALSQNQSIQTFQSLGQTTFFRASVANANCPAAYSNVAKVQVDQPPVAGLITGAATVCAGANTVNINVTGNYGAVNSWDFSTNNGSTWSAITSTNPILTVSNLTSTTLYRAKIQNGMCGLALTPSHSINTISLPTPTFQVTNGCAGTPLIISNTGGGVNSCFWDLGNGSYSFVKTPLTSYQVAGTYQIKLTETNSAGCSDSLKKSIIIYPNPSALVLGKDSACYGETILFTNLSTISSGNIQQTAYYFNDGSAPVFSAQCQHKFNSAGSYKMVLKTTSNFGCKDSITKTITVHPKPKSLFTIKNTCTGNNIYPANSSTISHGGLTFSWDFGNGFKSSEIAPQTKYVNNGPYNITLITKSQYSCSDTCTRTIHVNQSPSLSITTAPTCQGQKTHFSSGIQPVNQNVFYEIFFGDGKKSNQLNTDHQYDFPGNFLAQAFLTSDSGCVASNSTMVTIHPTPVSEFLVSSGCEATKAEISNLSYISKGTFINYWMSSNGVQQTEHPSINFDTPGTFTLGLITVSEHNCADTLIKQVRVHPLPEAAFKYANTCNGLVTKFHNNTTISEGAILEYKWDLGDNTVSSVSKPEKLYLNGGKYNVRLVAVSDHNCTDTVIDVIQIMEAPIADFSADERCLGQPVEFINRSILHSATLFSEWQFNPENTSTSHSPYYVFPEAGTYLVKLKVKSSDNCADSITKWVTTNPLPDVSAGTDITINKGERVQLTANGALRYNWYPAIGLSSPVSAAPEVRPMESSEFIVTGTDLNGCSNSDTVHIVIKSDFVVAPANILTPDQNGMNDTWKVKNIEAYPENKVTIFDQSNQVVYTASSYKNNWDGKNLKGELLPDSTYYYLLTFANSPVKYSGFITLMRNK